MSLSLQGVPGEGGAPGAVGPRVSLFPCPQSDLHTLSYDIKVHIHMQFSLPCFCT